MMLIVNLAPLLGAIVWFILIVVNAVRADNPSDLWWLIPATLTEILAALLLCGHFTLQPNQARVLILFGAYKGTIRTSAFGGQIRSIRESARKSPSIPLRSPSKRHPTAAVRPASST